MGCRGVGVAVGVGDGSDVAEEAAVGVAVLVGGRVAVSLPFAMDARGEAASVTAGSGGGVLVGSIVAAE